jgi:capsular exopolysaccharide synthesis family protein
LRYLRLPVLTVVPRATGKKRRKLPVGQEGERPTLITLQQPRSHPAECYRNLRTSILFSSGRPVPKTVLVTSAVAGEGKSTTAANLAVVMAQSGLKTVLVDADLRRPSLQRYFPRDPKRGLLRLLSDGIRVEEAVQESGVDNLSLLLCNSVPQTPSELLGSERAREVIDLLSSRYDVVVIDSPVVISVPDALILASRAAAVILVHRPGASNRDMVRHAREKLDEVKANVLGLVLNNVDIESGRYLYPEYAYYGYGHEKNGEASKGREKKP